MGEVLDKGLNRMADGLSTGTVYVGAYTGTGGTTLEGTPQAVTFNTASGGVATLNTSGGFPTIEISSGKTITVVRLQDTIASVSSSLGLAEDDAGNLLFTDGGNLLVKSFTVTVS